MFACVCTGHTDQFHSLGQGLDHSDSASVSDELRVSSFPLWALTLHLHSSLNPLRLPWVRSISM